ncbi:hypothetical protein TREES_T100015919 [Tupaia chinensis]|uniref:Uncharacterized protein n=1 Tax=Tupaia chinensis TaxID=246437 RepID=L9KXM5_TUPCH|nr:hypothetical protein TREES_T100015919 [Tupaia chinensis]
MEQSWGCAVECAGNPQDRSEASQSGIVQQQYRVLGTWRTVRWPTQDKGRRQVRGQVHWLAAGARCHPDVLWGTLLVPALALVGARPAPVGTPGSHSTRLSTGTHRVKTSVQAVVGDSPKAALQDQETG